ncbi:MAG: radical SAM protein [Candidatus Methanospirareceae archaeon]
MTVFKEVLTLRSRIWRQRESGEHEYKVVKSFAETTAESEAILYPYFRRFQPVKEERYRRTNIEAGFDFYTDSLMDYPSIIQYKVGGSWTSYNMLIAVHVPLCPYKCWHCFNDKKLLSPENAEWVTAKELVDAFCKQRTFDKEREVESNVLRITGGEPFLVPDLILECLQELKRQLPNDKVFLWTETDLWPFIAEDGESFVEQLTIEKGGVTLRVLEELAKYQNLAVHPCLHGLDDRNIREITSRQDLSLKQLLEGLKILLKYRIDIYPTFGSNLSPPEDIAKLFEELYALDRYLPLRFALVQYDLDYPEVERRLTEQQKDRKCTLYSKYTSLRIWNNLLMKHYNIGYAVIPRHLVALCGGTNPVTACSKFVPSEEYEPGDELVYIFKSSYREDYHRELLDILALPKGHLYRLEYDVEWVQDDLWQHMKMRPQDYCDREALLLYLDLDAPEKNVIPLRRLTIKRVDVKGKILVLHFELGGFARLPYRKPDLPRHLRSKLEPLFGKHTLGGTPLNKLLLVAEKTAELRQLEEDNSLSAWRQVVDLLHENKCIKFEKSLFYRVRIDSVTPATEDTENPATVYDVKGGQKVSMQVDYYLPNYDSFPRTDAEARTIVYETSSEIVEGLGPKQFTLSKYGSDRLIFRTAEVRDTQTCTIHFQNPRTPFEAPMLDILIRVRGSGTKIGVTRAASVVTSGLGGGALAIFFSLLGTGALNLWLGLVTSVLGVILLSVGGLLSTKYTRI